MENLFDFCNNLFNIIRTVADNLWGLLTTPISDYLSQWDLPVWLEVIIRTPLTWLFGSTGTLLVIIPSMIGIILLLRLVIMLFRG